MIAWRASERRDIPGPGGILVCECQPPLRASCWCRYVGWLCRYMSAWTHGINTNFSLCRKRYTRVENGGGIEESAGESECVCVHDSVSIWDMITFVGDDRMRYIETLKRWGGPCWVTGNAAERPGVKNTHLVRPCREVPPQYTNRLGKNSNHMMQLWRRQTGELKSLTVHNLTAFSAGTRSSAEQRYV